MYKKLLFVSADLRFFWQKLEIAYLPNLSKPQRRIVLLGVAGILMVFIGLALLYVFFVPPLLTDDEAFNLDYVWSIYNLSLPNFYNGAHLPFNGVDLPPVQWKSQHPPLFYLLLAPFVGPLMTWHSDAAILMGRSLSALFGVLTVLAIPSILNRWGITSKKILLTTTLLAAATVRFIGVSGTIYNDSLSTLLSVLSVGIMGIILIQGPKRKYLIALALVLAAGMLTKAMLIGNVIIGCFSVIASHLLHYKLSFRVVCGGSLRAIAIGLFAAIASGWFYWRNYRESGSFVGSHTEWAYAHLDRTPHSIFESLSLNNLFLPLHFYSNNRGGLFELFPLLVAILLFLGGAYLLFMIFNNKRRQQLKNFWSVGVLLVLQILITMAIYVKYVSIGGGTSATYLLPALLPFAFFLGLGSYILNRSGTLIAMVLAVGATFSTIFGILEVTGGDFVLTPNGALVFSINQSFASFLVVLFCSLIVAGFFMLSLILLGGSSKTNHASGTKNLLRNL